MNLSAYFRFIGLLPAIALVAGAAACRQEAAGPAPVLQAVAPEFAAVGDTVIIKGSYFSAAPTANEVTFNGIPGTVAKAGPASLSVVVPAQAFASAGIPAADIAVRVAGQQSTQNLVVKSPEYPRIAELTPATGVRVGSMLTLTGQGFQASPAASELLFPGANQTLLRVSVTSASPTRLQATVPASAASGTLWLITYFDAAKTKYVSETLPLTVVP